MLYCTRTTLIQHIYLLIHLWKNTFWCRNNCYDLFQQVIPARFWHKSSYQQVNQNSILKKLLSFFQKLPNGATTVIKFREQRQRDKLEGRENLSLKGPHRYFDFHFPLHFPDFKPPKMSFNLTFHELVAANLLGQGPLPKLANSQHSQHAAGGYNGIPEFAWFSTINTQFTRHTDSDTAFIIETGPTQSFIFLILKWFIHNSVFICWESSWFEQQTCCCL